MMNESTTSSINGPSAAAILASGVGCLVLGLMTTLAAAVVPINNALKFVGPVGPLSGKTVVTIVVWLVVWAALHVAWKGHDREIGGVFKATLVLIGLGLIGTFPVFFEMFIK